MSEKFTNALEQAMDLAVGKLGSLSIPTTDHDILLAQLEKIHRLVVDRLEEIQQSNSSATLAEVDNYVKAIRWSDDVDEYTKTLVIGNIRSFAFRAKHTSLESQLATATAERDEYKLRAETAERQRDRLIQRYGSINRWTKGDEWNDVYMPAENGYDFANEIAKERDGR